MLSLWSRIEQRREKKSVYCMPTKRPILFFLLCYSSTNGKISATKATLTLTLLYSAFQLPMGKSLKGYSTFSLLSTLWYNFTYYIVVVVVVLVVNENLSHFFWYCQNIKASKKKLIELSNSKCLNYR